MLHLVSAQGIVSDRNGLASSPHSPRSPGMQCGVHTQGCGSGVWDTERRPPGGAGVCGSSRASIPRHSADVFAPARSTNRRWQAGTTYYLARRTQAQSEEGELLEKIEPMVWGFPPIEVPDEDPKGKKK